MSDEQWIVIRNWRKFQRYSERNPPWIKNMTRLLHDDNYLELPGETRAILHGLWLEYASSNAQLRLNTRSLSYRLRLRVTRPQLIRLEQSGFIEFAHKPRVQDVCASRARRETETEKNTYEDQEQDLKREFEELSTYVVAREEKHDDDEDLQTRWEDQHLPRAESRRELERLDFDLP